MPVSGSLCTECDIFYKRVLPVSPRGERRERNHRLKGVSVRIAFPPGETNDTIRWIVWFLAVVNDKQIHCGISYQALRTHFGADFDDPLPAFAAHRPRIEQVITAFIEQGRFEEDETIVIRTRDLQGMTG